MSEPITFKRDGDKLSVSFVAIGYIITFSRRESSAADAEAWRRHLQAEADQRATYDANARQRLEWRISDQADEIRRLKRRVQYHRRQARRSKP